MFPTLLTKELRSIASSPKFAATLAVASLLVLISLATGLSQFRSFERQQSALRQLTDQELSEQTRWFDLGQRALRAPDVLQIFTTGSHHDIGRFSPIHASREVSLRSSVYEADPILAVFRQLDLTYVFRIVLTLYALLFTYDAISGERERGVLRLVAAHPVPRSLYVCAKMLGALIGLGLPLLLPLLLGMLGLVLAGVPLSATDLVRLGIFLTAGALLFAFFVVFGTMVSTLSRRASSSFLIGLMTWVVLVLVIPRVSVLTAAEASPVPAPAETAAAKDGVARQAWDQFEKDQVRLWSQRNRELAGLAGELREAVEDERLWAWMEEDERARQRVQEEIDLAIGRISEEVRNRQQVQEAVALGLARWSPTEAFQSVAMRLAGTHVDLRRRTEASMRQYRETFARYQLAKDPAAGAMTIRSDGTNQRRSGDDGSTPLDLSDLPRFRPPPFELAPALRAAGPDLAILLLLTGLCFAFTLHRFSGYDAR